MKRLLTSSEKVIINRILDLYNRDDLAKFLVHCHANDTHVRTIIDRILSTKEPVETALLIKDLDVAVGDANASLEHRHHHLNTRHDALERLCISIKRLFA